MYKLQQNMLIKENLGILNNFEMMTYNIPIVTSTPIVTHNKQIVCTFP